MVLPQGFQLPPAQKRRPQAHEVAWMATIPALATLTADERARLTAIKDGSTEPRMTNRATQLLNGTAFA